MYPKVLFTSIPGDRFSNGGMIFTQLKSISKSINIYAYQYSWISETARIHFAMERDLYPMGEQQRLKNSILMVLIHSCGGCDIGYTFLLRMIPRMQGWDGL